jgi:hypothetical protein
MNEETKRQVITTDGYDDVNTSDNLIQGAILKCVDGFWSSKDGTIIPPKAQMIALATLECLQHWQDQQPIETITKKPGKPLPDVDELNAAIPKKTWEKDLNGEPKAPWSKAWGVYLLDPKDASIYTYINSTVGAEIAVSRLKNRVHWMRALRGDKVVPVVELSSKPMKTKHGTKQRPEFTVVEWRELDALTSPAPTPAIEHMGTPVTEPSLKEEMNDEIPWDDPIPDLGKTASKKK